MCMVLSDKVKQNLLVVVDDLGMEKPKTKAMAAMIKKSPAHSGSRLMINSEGNNIFLAARNIAKTGVTETRNLNVADLLNHKYVMISKNGIKEMEKALVK